VQPQIAHAWKPENTQQSGGSDEHKCRRYRAKTQTYDTEVEKKEGPKSDTKP
jgi:hypothetical protein